MPSRQLSKGSDSAPTVGAYLARYLLHIGVDQLFLVPGDLNLVLLDELLKPITMSHDDTSTRQLKMIGCCNELNAGYSADGYGRTRGVAAMVVTHSVGSLSCINAVAGAYCEHIPLIVINGGLNSNSASEGEVVHHTLGETFAYKSYDYVRQMYSHVTVESVSITRPAEAPILIHRAIKAALRHSRPVYIDIACNISALTVSSQPVESHATLPSTPFMRNIQTDNETLKAAVDQTVRVLNGSKSPVLIAGQHLRPYTVWSIRGDTPAENSFIDLVNALNCAYVTMLDGKTIVTEGHPNYLGVYSGDSSVVPGLKGSADHTPGNALRDTVLSSDLLIYFGCVLSDYSSAGHTVDNDPAKSIMVYRDAVKIHGTVYHEVRLYDFISELSKRTDLKQKNGALQTFNKLRERKGFGGYQGASDKVQEEIQLKLSKFPLNLEPTAELTTNTLQYKLQEFIDTTGGDTAYHVVTETGDAWFTAMKLLLPYPHAMDIQLQYGSIGWAVGAVHGLAAAHATSQKVPKRRVLGLIGDGSFQLSAQELSTMIRYELNPIIVLINNHDYVIEEELHSGEYNHINDWKYSELPAIFERGVYGRGPLKRKPKAYKCGTPKELDQALKEAATFHKDNFVFIEVLINQKDSNVELGIWAEPVNISSSRKPHAPTEHETLKPPKF